MGVVVQQAPIVQAPIIETIAPAPYMAAPIVETFAPAPIMSAPIAAPIMAAPLVETFASAPIVSSPLVGGYGVGASYGAPIVETFGSTFAPSLATAPLVGSISAALPMTTMAAPTMTTM